MASEIEYEFQESASSREIIKRGNSLELGTKYTPIAGDLLRYHTNGKEKEIHEQINQTNKNKNKDKNSNINKHKQT